MQRGLPVCPCMVEDIVIGLAHQLAAERFVAFHTDGEETLDQVAVAHDKLYEVIVVGTGGEYGWGFFDC